MTRSVNVTRIKCVMLIPSTWHFQWFNKFYGALPDVSISTCADVIQIRHIEINRHETLMKTGANRKRKEHSDATCASHHDTTRERGNITKSVQWCCYMHVLTNVKCMRMSTRRISSWTSIDFHSKFQLNRLTSVTDPLQGRVYEHLNSLSTCTCEEALWARARITVKSSLKTLTMMSTSVMSKRHWLRVYWNMLYGHDLYVKHFVTPTCVTQGLSRSQHLSLSFDCVVVERQRRHCDVRNNDNVIVRWTRRHD